MPAKACIPARIGFGRSSASFPSLLTPSPCAGDRVCVSPGPPARPRPPCSWPWLCAWSTARRLGCDHLDRVGDEPRSRLRPPAGRRWASLAAQTLCSSPMPIVAPCNWARPWDRLKEIPLRSILLRRHAEHRQVPPQGFESFAVLQTDQVIRRDRLADRHRGRWRIDGGRSNLSPFRQPLQGRMQPFKQSGQIGPRHRIVRDERHHDLGRQFYRV